ncbi:MAG: response regulator [Pseudomonadota bacterium]
MSKNNATFQVPIENLNVVVVEQSKPMQTIMRSVLTSIKVSRVRIFDSVNDALRSMHSERPHVVLTDLAMQPTSGIDLIRLMRRPDMDPLCYVPVIVVTAQASRSMLMQAVEVGAHHVLAKPVSPMIILKTLKWLSRDARVIAEEGGRYIITGHEEIVSNLAETEVAMGGGGSGEDGLKFSRRESQKSGGSDSGLKFTRQESGEASDESLKFTRQDGAAGDDGLKFHRDETGQDEEAPSSVTPIPQADGLAQEDADEADKAAAAEEMRQRPRRAFAPISK